MTDYRVVCIVERDGKIDGVDLEIDGVIRYVSREAFLDFADSVANAALSIDAIEGGWERPADGGTLH